MHEPLNVSLYVKKSNFAFLLQSSYELKGPFLEILSKILTQRYIVLTFPLTRPFHENRANRARDPLPNQRLLRNFWCKEAVLSFLVQSHCLPLEPLFWTVIASLFHGQCNKYVSQMLHDAGIFPDIYPLVI